MKRNATELFGACVFLTPNDLDSHYTTAISMNGFLKRNILLFFFLLTTSYHLQAQVTLMSYGGGRYGAGSCLFRDYQAIGINPANVGIYTGSELQLTTGFLDANTLFFSDALPKSDIVNSLLKGKELSTDEKVEVARQFLENGNSFTAELMPVNFVIQFPKLGGFGFSWRERISGSAIFSEPLADIVFNGINSKYIDTIITDIVGNQIGIFSDTINPLDLFNGSSIQYNWLREYNLTYGRKIIGHVGGINVYAGGSIKFLQSNAFADVSFNNETISGFAAFSKVFDIDYANFTDPASQLAGRLTPIGRGMGYDAGVTVSYRDKFFAAASVVDIGSIKYTGNLVTIDGAISDSMINYIGVNAADIFTDFSSIFNADGLFKYLPSGEMKIPLATQLRIGGAWKVAKKLDVGFDVIQSLNDQPGSALNTQYAAIANFSPINNIKITGGLSGGGFSDFDVPAGISFSFFPEQIWQLSIGTSDLISIVKQDRPTISLNISILRFHYE
ncbi:MAG: DUF5723 family protein [Chitinophagales bacterium]|nr:DUF5723 family protein [Chitinophagales bacterium]